jgi:hypothetical protein
MIHPLCQTDLAAAFQTRGIAADLRDRSKYCTHAGHLHPEHDFVPASLETCGHPRKPVMRCISSLSDVASARSLAFTRRLFLAHGTERGSCAESGLCVPLFYSVACSGRGMAGFAVSVEHRTVSNAKRYSKICSTNKALFALHS